MTLLAHLRLVAVAIVLFGIVLSAPALAQKLGPDGAPIRRRASSMKLRSSSRLPASKGASISRYQGPAC